MRLDAAARAREIELPGVYQAAIGIQQEEIRRACGAVSLGHLLAGIDEIGKIPTVLACELGHVSRSILLVFLRIIGIDRHGVHTLGGDFLRQTTQRIRQVDHKRAMIAGKDHHQAGRS